MGKDDQVLTRGIETVAGNVRGIEDLLLALELVLVGDEDGHEPLFRHREPRIKNKTFHPVETIAQRVEKGAALTLRGALCNS